MLVDIGSEQTVDFQTRGENVLDLFVTNRPSLVSRQHPIPRVSNLYILGGSDKGSPQKTDQEESDSVEKCRY